MNGRDAVRSAVKAAMFAVSTVLIAVPLVSFRLRSLIIGRDRALEGSTQMLASMPGLLGDYLRRAFLHWTIAHCDRTASIGYGTLLSKTGASIGAHVVIGPRCHLGWVRIDEGVLIGPGSHVLSGSRTHGSSDPRVAIRDQPDDFREVHIGAGAWIGSSAVVMADVGAGSIVAAGSVVAEQVPPGVVVGGVPARILTRRQGVDVPPLIGTNGALA
ncbi:MAG: acyltransferase [Vicinamibacterales bacterium]